MTPMTWPTYAGEFYVLRASFNVNVITMRSFSAVGSTMSSDVNVGGACKQRGGLTTRSKVWLGWMTNGQRKIGDTNTSNVLTCTGLTTWNMQLACWYVPNMSKWLPLAQSLVRTHHSMIATKDSTSSESKAARASTPHPTCIEFQSDFSRVARLSSWPCLVLSEFQKETTSLKLSQESEASCLQKRWKEFKSKRVYKNHNAWGIMHGSIHWKFGHNA